MTRKKLNLPFAISPELSLQAIKRRQARVVARKAAKAAPVHYPPGYFTARLWPATAWPYAGWKPARPDDELAAAERRAKANKINADKAIEAERARTILLEGSGQNKSRAGLWMRKARA